MPGVHAVLGHFLDLRDRRGLIAAPKGWNYVDWVPNWRDGIPPGTDREPSGPINWQCALVLGMAGRLESWLGEPELSRRWDRLAEELAGSAGAAFWSKERGLMADNLRRDSFSEHTQCLALLSHRPDANKRQNMARGLLADPSLARTTIYFSHYLFETYRMLGAIDPLFRRLEMWLGLREMCFRTTLESPEPSRSDCHAWGAHPIHHYFATILGIRPSAPGFGTVSIAPQLGPLTRASGKLVHPAGYVKVQFFRDGKSLRGTVSLPRGVTGTFSHGGRTFRLKEGTQQVAT
jgi:alpha-L-rhamnosidase